MSSTFESDFSAGAAADLLAEFGEPVTFTPRGGVARSIVMIVERHPPDSVTGRTSRPGMRLTAWNHPTLGIDAGTFNAGGDKVDVATRKGGTAKPIFLIAAPVEQDDGMLVWEL